MFFILEKCRFDQSIFILLKLCLHKDQILHLVLDCGILGKTIIKYLCYYLIITIREKNVFKRILLYDKYMYNSS